jgi:hypothetical protein
MKVLIDKRARLAGMVGLLAAAVLLLPVKAVPLSPIGYPSAWAGGERGGIGDQVKTPNGYSNYLATEDPVTPCRSCYGGGGTDAQNISAYGQTRPCESCVTGSWGR